MAGEVLDMVMGAWAPGGRRLPASALVLSKETKAATVRSARTVLREEFDFIRVLILYQVLRVSIICVVFFQKNPLAWCSRGGGEARKGPIPQINR